MIVDVQGIPIEVEIRGAGRPLLLIHGWSADRRYMIADLEPILSAVSGWKRIYFDLPGHGATPAPDWLMSQDRAHDMPAYRAADWSFLARLEANYLLTGDAGRPGAPFDQPSLILGGRQDSRVGYRGAARLVEELPRATLAVIDLAGHHLGRIERPMLLQALVRDWLERLDSLPASSDGA